MRLSMFGLHGVFDSIVDRILGGPYMNYHPYNCKDYYGVDPSLIQSYSKSRLICNFKQRFRYKIIVRENLLRYLLKNRDFIRATKD